MSNKNYAEKLKDPRWQKKRLEIMNRDGFACKLCGDTTTQLQVHHLKYEKEPWDAKNENLECLCSNCHTIIEKYKDWFDIKNILKHSKTFRENQIYIAMFCKDGTVSIFSIEVGGECQLRIIFSYLSPIIDEIQQFYKNINNHG